MASARTREGKHTLSNSTAEPSSRSRIGSFLASSSTAGRNVLSLWSSNKYDERLPSSIADISYIPIPDSSSQGNDCILTVTTDETKENTTSVVEDTKKTLPEDAVVKPQTSRRVLRAGLEKLERQNKALQELCAKQRLDLDDATRDASQTGRLSAIVYKLELELKELKSKSFSRSVPHLKAIDTSAQDAIRLATLSRKAAAAGEAADTAQQQLREMKQQNEVKLSQLQQELDAAQQQMQRAGEENEQRVSNLQQQLSDAMAQINALKQEIKANSKSHAHELAAQQQDQSAATAAAAKRFDSSTSALKAQHDNVVMLLQAKSVSITCQYSAQLAELKLQHKQQLDAVRQQNAQSAAAAQEQHQQQLNAYKLQNDKTIAAARAESARHAAAVTAMQSELCSVKRQLHWQETTHPKSSRPFEPHALGLIYVPAVERQCKGHEAALGAIQNALEVTQAKYAAAKVHSLQEMSAFSAVQMQLYTDLKQEADGLASAQSKLQQAYRQQSTLTSPVTAAMRQLPAPLSFHSASSTCQSTGPQLRSTPDDNIPADKAGTALSAVHCISTGSCLTPQGVSLTPGGSIIYPCTSIPPVQPMHGLDAGHLIIHASVTEQSPARIVIHASVSGQSQGSSYHKGYLSSACDSAAAAAKDLASALQRCSCGGKTVPAASGSKKESVKAVNDFLATWADVKARTSTFFANLDRVEKKFAAGRVSRALRDEQGCNRIIKSLESNAMETGGERQPLTAVIVDNVQDDMMTDEQASADDDAGYESDDSWCIDDPTD